MYMKNKNIIKIFLSHKISSAVLKLVREVIAVIKEEFDVDIDMIFDFIDGKLTAADWDTMANASYQSVSSIRRKAKKSIRVVEKLVSIFEQMIINGNDVLLVN